MLIGSPPCSFFSILRTFHRIKPGGDPKVDTEIERAKVHAELCCEIYKYPMRCGRYLLHDHLMTASSWKLPCIEELAGNPD